MFFGIALMGFAAFQAAGIGDTSLGLSKQQLHLPVAVFLMNHTALVGGFPMLFLGIGLSLYNFLFYKSGFVPAWLALSGVLSYLLIFLFSIITLLVAEPPRALQICCWVPSIAFELMIGLYLLIKGVHIQSDSQSVAL